MIAMKREVAGGREEVGFSVERMSSYQTGDKSLYNETGRISSGSV